MAALESGDTSGAETRLLALTSGEAAGEATVGLGIVMETRGDTAAAADWYRKALALDPTNVPHSSG